jgi:Spy/CpxP family protein refolding chaperone
MFLERSFPTQRTEKMNIKTYSLGAMILAVIMGPVVMSAARADEEKALRPEIAQLTQTVSERLQAAADRLGLTQEQRDKISKIRDSDADQIKALRAERKALLQEELKAIGSILTDEQREKAKELAEDRPEQSERVAGQGLPRFVAARATLAERLEAAADKLGLTAEQRKQIATTLSNYAKQHAELKEKCRQVAEDEFKAVAVVLTPEQREKAHDAIEMRVLRAIAATSIADRLEALADKLGLSADQRRQVAQAHAQFAGQYGELRSDRRELLAQELKGIDAVLTPEQREKIKDFAEDRVVVIEVRTAARDSADGEATVRETIAERIEPVAEKLGLTAEQRTKIRDMKSSMAEKFKAQRDKRKALWAEEMKALQPILTPEQRDKVENLIEDRN